MPQRGNYILFDLRDVVVEVLPSFEGKHRAVFKLLLHTGKPAADDGCAAGSPCGGCRSNCDQMDQNF